MTFLKKIHFVFCSTGIVSNITIERNITTSIWIHFITKIGVLFSKITSVQFQIKIFRYNLLVFHGIVFAMVIII